jgi:hypothetical protein
MLQQMKSSACERPRVSVQKRSSIEIARKVLAVQAKGNIAMFATPHLAINATSPGSGDNLQHRLDEGCRAAGNPDTPSGGRLFRNGNRSAGCPRDPHRASTQIANAIAGKDEANHILSPSRLMGHLGREDARKGI